MVRFNSLSNSYNIHCIFKECATFIQSFWLALEYSDDSYIKKITYFHRYALPVLASHNAQGVHGNMLRILTFLFQSLPGLHNGFCPLQHPCLVIHLFSPRHPLPEHQKAEIIQLIFQENFWLLPLHKTSFFHLTCSLSKINMLMILLNYKNWDRSNDDNLSEVLSLHMFSICW